MGKLTMPLVPDGAVTEFYLRMHALHRAAGQPSMRQLQRGTRAPERPNGINPTTIHDAFCRPRPARWPVVEAIVEQLGGDRAEMRRLWEAASAAAADSPPAGSPPTGAARPGRSPLGEVPRDLLADVPEFAHRAAQLAELDALLGEADRGSAVGAVAVLTGPGGVGKTALATHWAHRVADRFPDGQLFVDLRGAAADSPLSEEQVLHLLLARLGVRPAEMPPDTAELRGRYRSLTAARRLLIVLDDAASSRQVRPLLPGTGSCVVLVTSRDGLTGLRAREGARHVPVGTLTTAESLALLRRLLGPEVDEEPAAAGTLAGYCAGLPLALRVAAEVRRSRPEESLARVVGELTDERSRLDLLSASGDEAVDVRPVLSWSYRRLEPAAARAFRMLGVPAAPDLSVPAVAALLGVAEPEAARLVRILAAAHLVEPVEGGQLRMHDLLRVYAGELARTGEPPAEREGALDRLLDYYEHGAAAADAVLFPHRRRRTGPSPQPPAGRAAGRAWLEREARGLVRQAAAVEQERPRRSLALAAAVAGHLDANGLFADALTMHRRVVRVARALADPLEEARGHHWLGRTYWRLGHLDEAVTHLQLALALLDGAPPVAGLRTDVLSDLGIVTAMQGRREAALRLFDRALALSTAEGDDAGQATVLGNLGVVHKQLGHYDEAVGHFTRARDRHREHGNSAGEAASVANLGLVHEERQEWQPALRCFEEALGIYRAAGHRAGEGITLSNIANILVRLGAEDAAAAEYERALAIAEEIGELSLEGNASNGLGELRARAGRHQEALALHRHSLRIAREVGDRFEEAQATERLADVLHATGRHPEAREHWRRALEQYEMVGSPHAEVLLARLADLAPPGGAA